MKYVLNAYFINFFIWWYQVKFFDVFNLVKRILIYIFIYLNIWPMLSNLFVPMFQDKSLTGRLIAFPIRLTWGVSGLMLEVVVFMLLALVVIVYLLFPILLIVGIIYHLIK